MAEQQNKLSSGTYTLLFSAALWAGMLALPLTVSAQTRSESAGGVLEEVIVTAQKREQSINDVGITINAFTAVQLENYGIRSVEGLETITPGMTITFAQPSGVPVFTIRGVGFADYTTSASSTVGLYLDEVNIPYSVMSRGVMLDIERVEVLKGPQGDLYGRNTTAGAINFISAKPTEKFEAGTRLSFGRFNVLDVEAFVSGSVSDSAQARMAVRVVNSNKGWQESLSRPGDTLGERDEAAFRGLLNWDINESASLLLNVRYFRDKSDNLAATPFDGTTIGNPDPIFLPGLGPIIFSEGDNRAADWTPSLPPQRDNTLKGVSAKLNWGFNGFELTSITAYDEFKRDEQFDTSGVAFRDADVLNTTDLTVFSQEIRFSSDNDSNLYWLFGAFYSKDKMQEEYFFGMQESFFGLFLGIDEIDTRYDQDTETIAGFGHIEWEFAEDFQLTLGLRYTEEDRKWAGCTYDTGNGGLAFGWNFILTPFTILANGLPDPGLLAPGGCGIYNEIPGTATFGQFGVFSQKIQANKWMYKTTLDYSLTDDILIYGTVSRGFKSGGFNGAAAQTHSQLLAYRPEELTAIELGIKSTLLDGRLQLNAAAFYYDYKDKQEPTIAVTPVGNISGLTNVPKSEVRGAELEIHWLLTEGLTWDVGIAYLDTEIKEYQAIDPASVWPNVVTFDASGDALANSPKWQATTTLTYEWPLSGGLMMMVAGDVSYKDDNDGAVQDPISSYTLVNARIGVFDASGQWYAQLWGRNIFDEMYWHSSSTSNCCFVRLNGMPATYGVTFGYRW